MSSRFGGGGHLDATSGREVVFCHACDHEWYKDERGESLTCPRCHGEATEIVDPQNDPRSMNDAQPGQDSDPDEADIDDYQTGFYARRNVFRGPDRFPPPPFGQRPQRTNPGDGADIIRSFTELLGDIGGPGGGGTGGGGGFGPRPGQQIGGPRRVTYQRFSGPNFTGGISSITITAPGRGGNAREPGSLAGGDAEFQRVFGDIFRGPPLDHDGHDEEHMRANAGGQNRPLDLATALNQLFANLLNPHGTYGDGVYTQEALDRIITNLMEANPQSNAPAPASAEAIESLTRKPLDEATLGPEHTGECTICIEDMKLGDMATFLPCKHWFHEECVVLWLKEHATCPICRAAIDGEAAGRPQQQATSSSAQSAASPSHTQHPQQPSQPQQSFAPSVPPDWTRPTWSQTTSFGNASGFGASDNMYGSPSERRRAYLREHGSARLDALRDAGQRDREQERLDRPSASRAASGSSNNNYGDNGDGSSSTGGGGGGPLSWLRDQFRDRRS
ncbi:uncharacterized protein B0I36DRAFT_94610 [Microdochium trichocladiopsis]|uniref:RING-type E3 ubiquitin transferase n=1 Tax=Microdochium trichocladiopsis TaxID=1682393 RepID=A0A9P8YER6_9PEZI|nr:uncharacterized protein B0I36DRAFT_94610 [Microdochium trichocladiopsis]KAH7035606.1 hypothetical protein B0I36DRAFT_94610 [Microdochium trichocladiopsis]